MFKEEQGVVVQGNIDEMKVMRATEVLAKHDENYMPPEIEAIESIKEKLMISELGIVFLFLALILSSFSFIKLNLGFLILISLHYVI